MLAGLLGVPSASSQTVMSRTVLEHFITKADHFDFKSPESGLGHVLRLDLDVTGDGRAEVFLGSGPTGQQGTTWWVYSPAKAGRYAVLGEMFFHPGGVCWDPQARLLSVSQRIEPHAHVVSGYRFTTTGIEWARSSKPITDRSEPLPGELRELSNCVEMPAVLSATPYSVAHGPVRWTDLVTDRAADPQPQLLSGLLLLVEDGRRP